MPTKVKICGITTVADACLAADAGADAIGLMFWQASPRHVSLETAEAIHRALPPHVLRVGVFVNAAPEHVYEAMARCGLTLLQFHGEEPPDYCLQFGLMCMKAFRMRDASVLEHLAAYPTQAWLLDTWSPGRPGGTGESFNWDLAVQACKMGRPVFLAGGLTPRNVGGAIRKVRPFGVDVSSGVEAGPGRKDPEKVRAFISRVRQVDEDGAAEDR